VVVKFSTIYDFKGDVSWRDVYCMAFKLVWAGSRVNFYGKITLMCGF